MVLFICWAGDIYALLASWRLVLVRRCCEVTEAGTAPKQRKTHKKKSQIIFLNKYKTLSEWPGQTWPAACGFYPRLPAPGASVMSPSRTLPVGASFVLKVRQLQHLLAGQPEGRVHQQARLMTQKHTTFKNTTAVISYRMLRWLP